MDIGSWLKGLGLGQYEAAFRENEIDDTVLLTLTAEDLKDLGVNLVGHRRKVLDAAAALRAGGEREGASDQRSRQLQNREGSAERRQVTVVFCDIVGSTALSARMDPEDLREVVSTYQKCAAEIIARSGGFVAQYLGDGVLAYFGYPSAHEDDPERAVRGGLELVAAVGALKTRAKLQSRVGIATGLVVVGDLIGPSKAKERGIIGETPNLAARLQGLAEPNMVIIAESTRTLLGNLFELRDLGATTLKGIAGAVRAWAVLHARAVESRFEALHASGLAALVGREEELELLLRRWARVKTGEGQVALLSGEAGIGKSRLTAALMERLAGEPHTRLRYFCSPQHTDSSLYPIIGQMERAAGLAHDDKAHMRLDKLDATLAQTSTPIEHAALFADMLSIPNDGRYPRLDLTPEHRRQRTHDALVAQMETLAREKPVLMIFEDAHWADPTSLEVLGRVLDRIRALRVLLLVTFRPEFEPPWIGQSHVTALTINRLTEREIGGLIDSVVGNKVLPANIRQDIIERTDGVPLFVEEMTKAVLETESEDEAQRTMAAAPSPVVTVPASLHASLMARLDRLGPAKGVAQVGAAIGREFSHALLAAVMLEPEVELRRHLERLISAGLLFRQGVPPNASYLFKHALVQDAAYGTLLRESRRALHARIAEIVERDFPEVVESQPELLARHCTDAGLLEKAARFWGAAGQRSMARSALVEAAEQFTRALDLVAKLAPSPATRREEIKLQVALITPLIHIKGYAAPETKSAAQRARQLIERAEALGEPPEDPLLLFSVLYSFWVANYVSFKGEVMCELADQFLTFAEQQGANAARMIGHRIMGMSLLHTGRIAEGRVHFDRAMALYEPAQHRPLATRFGQDVAVGTLSFLSLSRWMLGYPAAALADAERALAQAREISQAPTLMYALTVTSLTYVHCGNYGTATTRFNELVALADSKGVLFWKALGMVPYGCLLAMTGRASDAIEVITCGLTGLRSTGSTLWTPLALAYLALAHAQLGQFDEAGRHMDEAINATETSKESWFEADIHRLAGHIELLSPRPDGAKVEACFEQALAIARAQGAKSLELRAAMGMAQLWRDQGKRDEARDLLAPVHGWFTEGFDSVDLKESKALLDALA
jgi:class 3 adenylate cyclase/predicted ATPase